MTHQGLISPLMGPTVRPLVKAPTALLAQCPTIGAAVRQALIHAGLQQETMAAWLGVTAGHLSNQISGKKRFTSDQLRKIVLWTGFDLPAQKFCADCGGEFYFDQRKAQATALRAQADEIERAA